MFGVTEAFMHPSWRARASTNILWAWYTSFFSYTSFREPQKFQNAIRWFMRIGTKPTFSQFIYFSLGCYSCVRVRYWLLFDLQLSEEIHLLWRLASLYALIERNFSSFFRQLKVISLAKLSIWKSSRLLQDGRHWNHQWCWWCFNVFLNYI